MTWPCVCGARAYIGSGSVAQGSAVGGSYFVFDAVVISTKATSVMGARWGALCSALVRRSMRFEEIVFEGTWKNGRGNQWVVVRVVTDDGRRERIRCNPQGVLVSEVGRCFETASFG